MDQQEPPHSARDVVLGALTDRFGHWVTREELLRLCHEAGFRIGDQRIVTIKERLVNKDKYHIDSSKQDPPRAYALRGYPRAREIPDPPEPFRARTKELALVLERLRPGMIVTLHGVHGYGKSAIAKMVIKHHHGNGGTWPRKIEYLGLTATDHAGDRCFRQLAADLGIPQVGDPFTELKRFLAQPDRLVVIDQAEIALEQCRLLAVDLAQSEARVAVLVTCFLTLGVAGEVCVPVPGLDSRLPAHGEGIPDAVQLFLDHVSAEGDPTPEEIAGIAALCEGRGGNPLLIALAAGGLDGVRSVEELAAMPPSPDFLVTVKNEFEHLSDRQRHALARLSLLHSPWAFDDATASVAGMDVRDLRRVLEPLAGAAIQRATRILDRTARFTIEPCTQLVARGQLDRSKAVQDAAVAAVLKLLRAWLAAEPGAQPQTFRRIDLNYRTIMHAAPRASDEERVQFALDLLSYWQVRGRYLDADEMLLKLYERRHRLSPLPRARLLAMLGYVRCFVDREKPERPEEPDPDRLLREALTCDPGDPYAFGIASLGLTILHQDPSWLKPCASRCDLPPWIAADIRTQQGWADYRASRFEQAGSEFFAAYNLAREVEPRAAADAILGLAYVARRRCDVPEAEDWVAQADRIGEQLQDVTLRLDAINASLEFSQARGHGKAAKLALGRADRLLEEGGIERIRGRLDGSRGQLLRTAVTSRAGLGRSRELAERSLEVAQRLRLRQDQMWRHFDLGNISSLAGDPPAASASFEHGLALAVDATCEAPDRWQESRFRQRLARIAMIDHGAEAAIPELLDVADLQLELGVLDDLTWTLVDLEVAAAERCSHRRAEMLRGARIALCGRIMVGMSRKDDDLKSFDLYSDRVKAASAAVGAALGDQRELVHAEGEAAAAGAPQDVTGLKHLLADTRALLSPDT